MGRFSFVVVALLLAVNIAHHGALSNPIKKQKSVRLGRIEVSKHSDTCAVDLRGETYNGVCTTIKNCDLNVIDKDSVARNAGVAYKSAKCHAGKSCCADVLCIGGHGHCLDARTHKCAFATIGGQCLGGSTVKCCPLQESGLEDWQKEKFESHPRCLGGRGVCRPRRGAAGSSFPCKHGWVGGQCGKGANYCCPFSKNSKKEWENEKLQRKCDFIAPIAKELDLSIDILMAFEAVESGGTPNAIRFECHKFNQRARKQKFKKVSCTIKSGDSFSRVRAESGSQAFKTAYAINQKAALESTSFGLFQIMGGYMLALEGDSTDQALKKFFKDPVTMSGKLLILWFSDKYWGAHAAKAARKITSTTAPSQNKHWRQLVERYNGKGQVPYYVGRLKEEFDRLKGRCKQFSGKETASAFLLPLQKMKDTLLGASASLGSNANPPRGELFFNSMDSMLQNQGDVPSEMLTGAINA